MRKIATFILALALLVACQEKQPVRFTTSSPEITAYKKGVEAYEKADWATWSSMFSDTVKVYHNTWDNPSSLADTQQRHQNMIDLLSSYGFDKEQMVVEQNLDDDGETWVNFWSVWSGTLKANGKKITIPVHLTAQFVDGKIVQEYGFWDMSGFQAEMQALEAAAAAEEEEGAE